MTVLLKIEILSKLSMDDSIITVDKLKFLYFT